MKRFCILTTSLFLIFVLVACGSNEDSYDESAYLGQQVIVVATTPAPTMWTPNMPPPANPYALRTYAWPPPTAPFELEIDQNGMLSASPTVSAAIDADGTLWAWGSHGRGGLGQVDTESALRPVRIMQNMAYVHLSGAMSQAIDESGMLWQWGMEINPRDFVNHDRQIGVPYSIMENTVMLGFDREERFYVLTKSGEFRSWSYWSGRNLHIDLTQAAQGSSRTESTWAVEPSRVLTGIRQFSSNENANLLALVTYTDELHLLGFIFTDIFLPLDGSIMSNVARASVGQNFVLSLTNDGRLYAFGDNSYGQIGTGSDTARYREMQFIMDNVVHIYAGADNAFAITSDGRLYGWGNNNMGKLGDGTTTEHRHPVFIMDNVNNVAAGTRHTLAITNDGRLYGWGENRAGQLGQGEGGGGFYHSPVFIMDNVKTVQR